MEKENFKNDTIKEYRNVLCKLVSEKESNNDGVFQYINRNNDKFYIELQAILLPESMELARRFQEQSRSFIANIVRNESEIISIKNPE